MSEALRKAVRTVVGFGYQLEADCLEVLRNIEGDPGFEWYIQRIIEEQRIVQKMAPTKAAQICINRSTVEKVVSRPAPEKASSVQANTGPKVVVSGLAYAPNQYVTEVEKAVVEKTGFLIGGGYDGDRKCAVLTFYSPKTQKCFLQHDMTGHKPYCYVKEPASTARGRLDALDPPPILIEEERFVALEDAPARFTKVVVDNPQQVFHEERDCVRKSFPINEVWESNIRYQQSYIYDRNLIPSIEYGIHSTGFVPVIRPLPPDMDAVLEQAAQRVPEHSRAKFVELGRTINQPIPYLNRVALDIEVETEGTSIIPSPDNPTRRIIATSLVDDKGESVVYVLDRGNASTDSEEEARKRLAQYNLPDNVAIRFTTDESLLIQAVFQKMREYPCVVTFNGDDFDLRYLFARSAQLGMNPADTSGLVVRRDRKGKKPNWTERVGYKHGVHIDLMRLFKCRALRVYAFEDKYQEENLDAIATALLGRGKIPVDPTQLDSLPPYDLAFYCLNDAILTMELTTYSDNFIMNLLFLLSRITRTFIEDMSRTQISSWVRNLLDAEHRQRNAIIPIQTDFDLKRVGATTTSIIKGKKYKGAVVETATGVFFDVTPYDFSSMYPSIIKVRNVSYETTRCIHPECQSNIVPETKHWICTKHRGIVSETIGLLRDVRVYFFKPLAQSVTNAEQKHFINTVSQALKVILNSSYGILGFENFQYYYLPAAEAVAAWGRHHITAARQKSVELGLAPVIIDTDSLYLPAGDADTKQKLMKWCEENTGIEMDAGSHFKYVVASGLKKNYFGVTDDGRVVIRGLTGKKRHIPNFIRRVLNDVLTNVLAPASTKDDLDKAKDIIKERVKDAVEQLRLRHIPLTELEFHYKLSRPLNEYKGVQQRKAIPQHVKVAQMLQERGQQVGEGQIIRFVKTRNGASPTEFVQPDEVDVTKYIQFLCTTFTQIFQPLEIDMSFNAKSGGLRFDNTRKTFISEFV